MSAVLQGVMDRFEGHDPNADGAPAIVRLSYMPFEPPAEEIPAMARLVLVLVESRLADPLPGGVELGPSLVRYKSDLRAEGFENRFLRVELYHGPRHQDGRTLLSLRRFLREVKLAFPNFLGVLLVGAFPEAALVRRAIWRPAFDKRIAGTLYQHTPYLAIEPEEIAPRSEIVLADINGNWENLYREDLTGVESVVALPDAATAATAWPVDGAVFTSTVFDRTTVQHRDFFFVNDGDYVVLPAPPGQLHVLIRHRLLHPEVSAADRALANPMAQPDILVSRINALHVAVNPDPAIVGTGEVRPLDAAGVPQPFDSPTVYDTWLGFYKQDPALERRVLVDYFDRNHRYRTGAFADLPFRAAGLGHSFSGAGAAGYLAPASTRFGPPLIQENATVLDYVRWFEQPAVLRCIQAHSSAFSTQLGDGYNPADLEAAVGGHPFRWRRAGTTYTPSLQDQGSHADLYVHRTVWNNRRLAASGTNLIVHGGCEVNTPAGTEDKKYYEEGYAPWQNAEGLLFFMNGVALIARAKVFNDLPTGFPGAFALASRARFGDGWKAFYDNEAADPSLAPFSEAIRSKKAYFWSVVGDWTVRLRYRGGLGVIGSAPVLRAVEIHPDHAWIGGWNFVTGDNTVRAVGDLDGNGTDDIVLTSDWGIGILGHDGQCWRAHLVAPNDTWFGGWRFNASVNVGRDRIHGTGRYTGRAGREILVTSSWGIGLLARSGASLNAVVIQPNGTRFGGWLFDSRANQIVGIADLNGDGKDEVVVISDWGIGVLAATGNTFSSPMLAANGTRFGGWLFASRQNTIHGLGDFDGDGASEMVVSSAWGIGLLKLQGNQLTSIAMHANGSNMGGYVCNTTNMRIAGIGDFDGDGRAEMLIADPDGLHILELRDGQLVRIATLRNGERAGGWLLDTARNDFGPVGDVDGDGQAECAVRSPWGIGVLGQQGAGFRCIDLQPNGAHLGDWILEPKDRIAGIGNFAGPPNRKELLLQKGN